MPAASTTKLSAGKGGGRGAGAVGDAGYWGEAGISQGLSPTLPVLQCDLCQPSEALSASISSFAKWGGKRHCNPHRDSQIKPFSGTFGEM